MKKTAIKNNRRLDDGRINYHGENKKGTTIMGMLPQQARALCRYVFRDYYVGLEADTVNLVFKLKIYTEVEGEKMDKAVIDDFISYWGGLKKWKIILINTEEYKVDNANIN